MADYAIGDIQGCYDELQTLLTLVEFDRLYDRLFIVGDLVNRGPKSAEVLRWAMSDPLAIQVVLGNHDLHLLAVWAGVTKQRKADTFDDVLNAADSDVLLSWLRVQPLIRRHGAYLFIHAGLFPAWCADEAIALAGEVESLLAGADYISALSNMYGDGPNYWSKALSADERFRFAINTMTRMRVLYKDGGLQFSFKGKPLDRPLDTLPWFDFQPRVEQDCTVVFGHWSALGLTQTRNTISLDTGCVWGEKLTAIRLDDGKIFQVQSKQPRSAES